MENYNMLFEGIVLAAWDKQWRCTDPFKLGDAGTLQLAENNLSGCYGHNAKFALSSALRKVAAENEGTEVYMKLIMLDNSVWAATNLTEIFDILDETKNIFETLGKTIF